MRPPKIQGKSLEYFSKRPCGAHFPANHTVEALNPSLTPSRQCEALRCRTTKRDTEAMGFESFRISKLTRRISMLAFCER